VVAMASGVCNSSNVFTGVNAPRYFSMRWLVASRARTASSARNREARGCSDLGHFFQRCPCTVAHGDQAPTLVPATQSIGIPASRKTRRTPRCAIPRAKTNPRGQTDAWAFPGSLCSPYQRSEICPLRSEASRAVRRVCFFRHFSSLALSTRIGLSFDPRMPVL